MNIAVNVGGKNIANTKIKRAKMLSYYYYMLQYKNDDSDFGDLARMLRDDKIFPKKNNQFL